MNIPWEAIEGLFVYIVGSTIGFVWWMATVTADMKVLKELVRTITEHGGMYARKDDIARELGVIEKNQETMWAKFEKLKEKVDSNGKG